MQGDAATVNVIGTTLTFEQAPCNRTVCTNVCVYVSLIILHAALAIPLKPLDGRLNLRFVVNASYYLPRTRCFPPVRVSVRGCFVFTNFSNNLYILAYSRTRPNLTKQKEENRGGWISYTFSHFLTFSSRHILIKLRPNDDTWNI